MPNSIALITKYSAENLDKVFKANAVTTILEGRNKMLNFTSAKEVKVPEISMSGLGNYGRAGGTTSPSFPTGSVTVAWGTHTLTQDRAISFEIDAMDNEETAGIAYGELAAEFVRTQVVPEIDAYRLSTLLSKAGNTVNETIAENTIIATFNKIIKGFQDDEVNTDEMVFYISTEIDLLIKGSTELQKVITQSEYKSGDVTFKVRFYEGIPLIVVPGKRFKTAYDFETGRGTTPKFGFTPKSTALDINILAVHFNSAIPVEKHAPTRYFAPGVYQGADAHVFQQRIYHDIFTTKNKTVGIRASVKPKV